jgi:sigma-E factor negative regulatory protein RseA
MSESASTIQPVVVQTAQGQVLRDARLEQLLSEHRQFGGMSALQAPAGFLRNATYDAAPQR